MGAKAYGVMEAIDASAVDTGIGGVAVGRVEQSGVSFSFSLTLNDVLNGTVLGNIAGAENAVGDSGVLLRVVVVGDGVAGDGGDGGVVDNGSMDSGVVDNRVVDSGAVDNRGGGYLNVSGLLNNRLDDGGFNSNNGDASIGVVGQGKTSGVGEGDVKPGGVDKSRVGFRLGGGGCYQSENY